MSLTIHITRNFLARGVFALTNILVTVLLARLLGAADSGRLFYLINNFAIAALVGSLCLETGMTYYLSRKEIALDQLPAFIIGWSLFAGALSYLLFYWIFQLPGSDPMNAGHALYAWVFISGTICSTYYTSLFYAQKKFLLPLLFPAGSNLLMIALCYLSASHVYFPVQNSLIPAYVSLALINATGLAIIFHRYNEHTLSFTLPRKETVKKIWTFSRLALLTNILSFLALRVDYWILHLHLGRSVNAESLGNYIQVSKMYQAFLLLPSIIATVIFPVTAAGDSVNMRKKVMVLLRWMLAGTSLITVFLGAIGGWAFPLLFGDQFTYLHSCYLASIVGIISLSLISILAAYFSGTDNIKYSLAGSFIAFIVVVALNFILIPRWGINGAAWADSIGYFSYLCFLGYFFLTKTRSIQ